MDIAAELTVCTKVVAASRWTVSGTSSGLAIVETSAGMKPWISLLSMQPQTSVMVCLAQSLTSCFISHIMAATFGTIKYMRSETCSADARQR